MTEAAVIPSQTYDVEAVQRRRAATRIRQLSHTAVRVDDMSRTRAFYEDLLGLPLVSSLIADFDVVTNDESNYIHCMFELADGSCIAFFQFEKGYRGAISEHTDDPYERHIALRVDTEADVDDLHERSKALGVDCFIVDHDWCYSLYMTDPDGERVEVTMHRPSADIELNQPDAHARLENWLANPTRGENRL